MGWLDETSKNIKKDNDFYLSKFCQIILQIKILKNYGAHTLWQYFQVIFIQFYLVGNVLVSYSKFGFKMNYQERLYKCIHKILN